MRSNAEIVRNAFYAVGLFGNSSIKTLDQAAKIAATLNQAYQNYGLNPKISPSDILKLNFRQVEVLFDKRLAGLQSVEH